MNRQEVTLILAKASAAYPNQAPNLPENPSIFELWCEMLADVDPQLGLVNLNRHIMTNSFFPTIADIAKQPEKDDGPYTNHKQLTSDHLLFLENAKARAVPMPEDMFKEWLEDE